MTALFDGMPSRKLFMTNTMSCSDATQLQRLAAGDLPDPEREAVLVHLESCTDCVRRLGLLPEQDPLAGLMRQAGSLKGDTADGLDVAGLMDKLHQLKLAAPPSADQPLSFICSQCSKPLRVKSGLAGKRVKCPACKQILTVPSPATPNRQPPGQTQEFAAPCQTQPSTQGGFSASSTETHGDAMDKRRELLPAQATRCSESDASRPDGQRIGPSAVPP
jgi:phage FluMu protein Com